MNNFIKSPFNYVGNKYKQLPQLFQLFPSKINNFIDLFTGGADVAINMKNHANQVYANDINKFVIDIMKIFQNKSLEEILNFIDNRIAEFSLTKINKEGYLKYRELYNLGEYQSPLDLFVLTRFSFNNNIRFNGSGKFNEAFGMNRSSFNPIQRNNTIKFYNNIQSIFLSCKEFSNFNLDSFNDKDFIYCDPPYLISDAYYNGGAKEVAQRWEQKDDLRLFDYLNKASSLGIKFAMSNFIYHKGKANQKLIEWIEDMKLNTYDIHSDYTHCVANIRKNDNPTLEIVVTNYKEENKNE